MASPTSTSPKSSRPTPVSGKALISGKPSTPSEVTIAYALCRNDQNKNAETVVLLHGYPETNYQFRHILMPLVKAGYTVVAPDYRGAGDSSRPAAGYDKVTMAEDIHELLTEHLDIQSKVHLVGHDIGGMIAYAYASRYPDETASIAWGECPLPGTTAYDNLVKEEAHGGLWHFIFHWQEDLPEALTQGREQLYLQHFYHRLTHNPTFPREADLEHYTRAFQRSGGMRAGFELYRAFHQDAEDNRAWLEKNGKCNVPCLWMGGDYSFLYEIGDEQCGEVFESFEKVGIEDAGHWIAEENPEGFCQALVAWIRGLSK